MATKNIPQIRQNATGFVLTLRTNTSLENSTDLKLIIKSDLERKEKELNSTHITNSANGEVSYTIQDGDLSATGKHKVQVIDVTGELFLPSEIVEFNVVENL
jgi:hypothetical protein